MKAIIPNARDLGLVVCVYGDKRRFIQIFNNILTNAMKFTNKGGSITILLEPKESREQSILSKKSLQIPENDELSESFTKRINLKISIIDTGIGMSEEG